MNECATNCWRATSAGYPQAAVSTFFQVADYYLVAYSLTGNFVVVTNEVPSSSAKVIKIPNACIALGVKCMSPYDMLRVEKAKFVLATK